MSTEQGAGGAFLSAVYGGAVGDDRRLVVFTKPDGESRQFTDLEEAVTYAAQKTQTQDVYVGCGLYRPVTGTGRGKSADVTALVGVWGDIDILGQAHKKGNLPPDEAAALGILDSLAIAPSIVIHSGHGLQAWWLFVSPFLIGDEDARARACRLTTGWGCYIRERSGFDLDSVFDLARVLRLPGTVNRKGEPVPVRILQPSNLNGDVRRYSLEQFLEFVTIDPKVQDQPAAAPVPVLDGDMAGQERRCRAYLSKCPDAISGNRGHDATLRAACECFRFGLDDSAVLRVMQDFNRTKTGTEQWSDEELAHKIESARAKVEAAGEVGMRLKKAAPPPGRRLCTDLGNAARFVAVAGDDLRYCGAWGKWLSYDGSRWRVDDNLRVTREAKRVALSIFDEARKEPDPDRQKYLAKWAIQSQKRERLAAMVDLARCELPVSPTELDADLFLLNVLNGTMDLRTGDLQEHRREDFITKLAPVVFDVKAMCPIYDAFMVKIMAGNKGLIAYLDKIMGMCLTGDVREQVLVVFYGTGANGKSVTLDTWTGFMGDYAAEAAPSLLIDRHTPEHPTETADLCGKRLVVSCETEEGGRLKVQLVKRLTGNATLKARYMRQDYFQFERTHKMILATNNRPVIREGSLAVWRRIQLIPFDVTIPPGEQDKELLGKLRAEWPGILARAVRGCLAWQREGLQTPPEVEAATEQYRSEQDPTAEFLAAACILAANAYTPRTDVFNAYQTWAGLNHERYPLGRNDLYSRIRLRPEIGDGSKRIGARIVKVFTGIGLLSASAAEVPNGLL